MANDPASIEGVIFDLDGTLVDSAPDIQTSVNRVLDELGRRPLALADVATMIGEGAETLVTRALQATGGVTSHAEVLAATKSFLSIYQAHSADRTRPYPGVAPALAALAAAGLKLGLCTNKPEAATRALLQALGLAGFFRVIVGGDTLPGVRKPDPRPVAAVLEALGVAPTRALLIGDSGTDVAVARAAGVRVWLRRGGYTVVAVEDLAADAVFDRFDELPTLLLGLS